MSNFAETIEKETTKQPRKTFKSDYIRITEDHDTVIRILDDKPFAFWQHWVGKGNKDFPAVNAGRGISMTCAGFEGGKKICPICASNDAKIAAEPDTDWKEDKNRVRLLNARKVFALNVLDRTPTIICPSCDEEHYEESGVFPTTCVCGASLASAEPEPRNVGQILQKGITMMKNFVILENNKAYGDLSTYDITISTLGKDTKAVHTCVPSPPTELVLEEVLGEQELYDIKGLAAPMSPEDITKVLDGADYYEVIGSK